jgi:hypothetical protein
MRMRILNLEKHLEEEWFDTVSVRTTNDSLDGHTALVSLVHYTPFDVVYCCTHWIHRELGFNTYNGEVINAVECVDEESREPINPTLESEDYPPPEEDDFQDDDYYVDDDDEYDP